MVKGKIATLLGGSPASGPGIKAVVPENSTKTKAERIVLITCFMSLVSLRKEMKTDRLTGRPTNPLSRPGHLPVPHLPPEDAIELAGAVDLFPDLGPAKPAPVLITVPVREDQKEELVDGHCSAAFGAIKFRGLELVEIRSLAWAALSGGCGVSKGRFSHG